MRGRHQVSKCSDVSRKLLQVRARIRIDIKRGVQKKAGQSPEPVVFGLGRDEKVLHGSKCLEAAQRARGNGRETTRMSFQR